jgi:hypothetical protein
MYNRLIVIGYVQEYWTLLLVLLKHSLSLIKEKIFNPEYNTDIKHSGNLMEHQILYITLLFHNDILIPSFLRTRCASVHYIYTFEVELYTIYNYNLYKIGF